ncbi:unnamed protein product [Cutaneotrichosporon oleaginosum]
MGPRKHATGDSKPRSTDNTNIVPVIKHIHKSGIEPADLGIDGDSVHDLGLTITPTLTITNESEGPLSQIGESSASATTSDAAPATPATSTNADAATDPSVTAGMAVAAFTPLAQGSTRPLSTLDIDAGVPSSAPVPTAQFVQADAHSLVPSRLPMGNDSLAGTPALSSTPGNSSSPNNSSPGATEGSSSCFGTPPAIRLSAPTHLPSNPHANTVGTSRRSWRRSHVWASPVLSATEEEPALPTGSDSSPSAYSDTSLLRGHRNTSEDRGPGPVYLPLGSRSTLSLTPSVSISNRANSTPSPSHLSSTPPIDAALGNADESSHSLAPSASISTRTASSTPSPSNSSSPPRSTGATFVTAGSSNSLPPSASISNHAPSSTEGLTPSHSPGHSSAATCAPAGGNSVTHTSADIETRHNAQQALRDLDPVTADLLLTRSIGRQNYADIGIGFPSAPPSAPVVETRGRSGGSRDLSTPARILSDTLERSLRTPAATRLLDAADLAAALEEGAALRHSPMSEDQLAALEADLQRAERALTIHEGVDMAHAVTEELLHLRAEAEGVRLSPPHRAWRHSMARLLPALLPREWRHPRDKKGKSKGKSKGKGKGKGKGKSKSKSKGKSKGKGKGKTKARKSIIRVQHEHERASAVVAAQAARGDEPSGTDSSDEEYGTGSADVYTDSEDADTSSSASVSDAGDSEWTGACSGDTHGVFDFEFSEDEDGSIPPTSTCPAR